MRVQIRKIQPSPVVYRSKLRQPAKFPVLRHPVKNETSFLKAQYAKLKGTMYRLFSAILGANYGRHRRIVLLDGCNVGYFHSNHRGFSIHGLQLALNYFRNNGFETYAMIPKFRLKPGKSTDHNLLNQLYMNEMIICTPCKEYPRRAMSYDDRFMMDICHTFDCAVVSNDRYRDLMGEKPEYAEVIQRRIPFEWMGNTFQIPDGINNPNLYL
jgi:hypothetical protein